MIFNFSIAVSLIPVFMGLAILLVGVIVLAKVSKLGGALTSIFGVFFLVLFGPMLFMDKVEVGPEGIKQSTGFWFTQTKKGLDFNGLDLVLITKGRDMKNRPIELWIAEYKSGKRIEFDPGDLWESNGRSIISYMEGRGIKVVVE